MTFKTALRARLKADTTVTAQNARVDWNARPQGSALPAIVLETVAAHIDQHMGGPMGTNGNRIQATVIAETQAQAEAIKDAVVAVLMAPGSQGGVTFQGGFINLTLDGADNTTTKVIFHEIIDATVWFN